MSRDPREPVFTDVGWRGSLACHKRGKDIHFNKQINEIGDTSTRRFFGNAGTRSRATGVLLFAEAGLEQRKKGNASFESREVCSSPGQLLFESLSRGLIVAESLPHERYICYKPRIDKCWFGPWIGPGPTIYDRTLNYSTSSQYSAHFYIIVYDRDRVR